MNIEAEFNGTLYRLIGGDWYDTVTYIRAPQVVARELHFRLRQSGTAGTSPPRSTQPVTSEGDENSSFRHAEVFPIVAELIRERHKQKGDYITHHEIVDTFLADSEGNALTEEAAEQQGKPIEKVASNIIAWFSKRFTEGETPYQDEFERKKIDGRWAYRLRSEELRNRQ